MDSKNVKKTDIILAGVGGQGILSVAATIGEAAVRCNLYLKQAETHGMSQRGGEVQPTSSYRASLWRVSVTSHT